MRMSIRTITAAAAIGVVGLLATTVAAAPAQAHEAPKFGSTCAMSGMVEYVHGDVYVCRNVADGTKPRWGRGLTIGRSPLVIADGWAKAADKGMSAAFGMIKNPTSKPIRVLGATSTYSKVVQLHEVVDKDGSMVMQQKLGGFVIPANGMIELKPGGNHLMFMDLTKPIKAGQMIPITLVTSTGALMNTKVIAKVFTGANETYDSGMSGMSGM
jgi:copper(I)-binding protein